LTPINLKKGKEMIANAELLKKNGVDKVVFYFKESPLTDNVFTTCLFINKKANRIEARGVSICSLLDEFSKTKGKQKASGRALKALLRKQNFFKINKVGRLDERVKKEVLIKSDEDNKKILNELSTLDAYEKVVVRKSFKKYTFEIPANYPMSVANKNFKYKAEFRPEPANSIESSLLNEGC
jgi:hypothetical protein